MCVRKSEEEIEEYRIFRYFRERERERDYVCVCVREREGEREIE